MPHEAAKSDLGHSKSAQPTAIQQRPSLPRKRFLGWKKQSLHSIVEVLLSEHAKDAEFDLRELTVFLPGSLASRRLKELLALRSEQHGLRFYPPRILTIGSLPEQLYVSKLPFANPALQQVAWMRALLDTPSEELQRVVSVPPPKTQTLPWLELGNSLARVHRDLASERLDFRKVLEQLASDHPEHLRWQTLQAIQQRYLSTLHQLQLWDIQTARLYALDHQQASTSRKLIVAGCVDLNETQRGFLAAVAEHVEIWILSPESAEAGFDDFGCVVADFWATTELDIPSERLLVTNSPSDQAELVAGCLADFGDRYHLRDVTLSVPDPNFIPEFRRRFDLSNVKSRYGPGRKLLQSEPVRLLGCIGKYLEGRSYQAFATLLRQPAVEQLLLRSKVIVESQAWLAEIDRYYQSALPKRIDNFIDSQAPGASTYSRVRRAIQNWLSELNQKPAKLATFVEPLLRALATAYDQLACDSDSPEDVALFAAAEQTSEALLALRDIPFEAQPTLNASEMISWLLINLGDRRVAEKFEEDSLEIIGWLDLLMDDAAAAIVAGIHDDVLPGSLNADAFLPNSLRQKLGMADNTQRLARDLYATRVLLESREEVRFVVGKTDAVGDPLLPSRLLMAGSLQHLPARVLHLVSDDYSDCLEPVEHRWRSRFSDTCPAVEEIDSRSRSQASQATVALSAKADPLGNQRHGPAGLNIPIPKPSEPPQQITVTAFRDYLQCPYRFYLRHIRRLRPAEDTSTELDASQFGNLIHDTLALLDGPIAASQDAKEIEEFLVRSMREIASKRYGRSPSASILIQLEQAEMRLAAFAHHQAAQAEQGWRTKFLEQGVDNSDGVLVGSGDHPLNLVGRIDRIDVDETTGQWAIWDYKTSENAKDPVAAHWNKKDGWIDLQLPLYIRIAEHLGAEGLPSLGYINVPKQTANIGFHQAKFTSEQLDDAMRIADEIADKVASGEFWPLRNDRVVFDDFSRICQTRSQRIEAAPPATSPHRTLEREADFDAKTLLDAARIAGKPMVQAIDLPPTLIRASAGTGKTFQLTNRLLQILLTGQNVDSILATTFTRKAAGEIMGRVLERLALACLDAQALDQLRTHLPGVHVSQANCLAALRRLTMAIHRFRVCTLDSYFAQVARAFSFEMSLPQGWSPLDPAREMQFQLSAIGHVLEQHDRKTLLDLVRMLAKGESSRRIAEEISRTVNAGYPAFRITAEKDWNQLKVDPAASESALESALQTIGKAKLGHGSADKQLEKLHLSGRSGDWESVIAHGIYSRLDNDPVTYFKKEIPNDLLLALRLLEERAAAELLSIRSKQTQASYKVLAAYDRAYVTQLRQTRLLAFADVTHYLAKWLDGGKSNGSNTKAVEDHQQNNHEADSLARRQLEFRLDCGVRHLLLDEFQDTSPQQWQILEPLAKPLAVSGASQQSFFVVGDTKQAIYGWRGGVSEVFDAVVKALPGLSEQELRHSYRSSPEVLETVNEVFLNLERHPNFGDHPVVADRWSNNFPAHHSMLDKSEAKAGFARLQNGPKIDSSRSAEERRQAFLDFSASQIEALCRRSSASIGVLLRTNTQVAEMIALLQDRGVSASQDGGNPLTDSSAVELLLSAIHLADHPGDSISRFHVAHSPIAKKFAKSPFDGGKFASWLRQQVCRFGLGKSLESLAEMLCDHISWWDQNRVEQLIRMAHEFDIADTGRLRDFERSVESRRVALPSEAQVQVMTIHKSKGLEFDAVFLPDLQIDLQDGNSLLILRGEDPCQPPTGVLRYMNYSLQRSLPASWQTAFAQHKQRQMNETLCLLYVAMTRAKHGLYMTSKPTSRPASQQLGSILQSTLAELESHQTPEATLYERGDPEWMLRFPVFKDEAGRVSNIQPRRVLLRSGTPAAGAKGLQVAAPSHISRDREKLPLSQAFAVEHSSGAIYGRLIHAFFQQVQWLDDFRVEYDQLNQVALQSIEPDLLQRVSVERAVDEFSAMLDLNCIQTCLSKSRYQHPQWDLIPERVEIENEHVICGVMDGQLISGTIDRLAVLYHRGQPYAAEIFDFKTDAYDPSLKLLWLDDRVQFHRPQLETYTNFIASMFGLDVARVAAHLLMLNTDDCVRIDALVPPPHMQARNQLSAH